MHALSVIFIMNLYDQVFRDEFVDGGTNGYDIIGWAEPQEMECRLGEILDRRHEERSYIMLEIGSHD